MNISFSHTSLKKLRRYPGKMQKRIISAIEKLPEKGNIKKIHCPELPPLYRLRAGNVRIIFQIQDEDLRIVLIDNRGDVYKKV